MLFVADCPLRENHHPVTRMIDIIDGENFFKITDYDLMKPFFMTLVSHSDHWLFISSTGGLTTGRKNERSSLFPYYTDDKITDSYETTGSKSIFRVHLKNRNYFWEPFSYRYSGLYGIRRNLYKNTIGNKIIFEEINEDLGLIFRYSWQFSDSYGIVRKSSLKNVGKIPVNVEILDGVQNILPYGVHTGLQNEKSNLVNAYKKNELDTATGMGMFILSSIIIDRPEPSEALKATTVWSSKSASVSKLLSSRQVNAFRNGDEIRGEMDIRGEPGAYFIHDIIGLQPSTSNKWLITAELNQDHTDINNLIYQLKTNKKELLKNLEEDINVGSEKLIELVARADGLQVTDDYLICSRHYTNVLFNIMRGGIFANGYTIDSEDYKVYTDSVNKFIIPANRPFFNMLPREIEYKELLERANKSGDNDLIRVTLEYLPLTFSRRHGDPSRPWNKFSIETRKDDGSMNLDYQGNWRDIFQNWEALALSYPGYINSMIAKFVNASTIDGYNPYRITRGDIDWEVNDPDDPWSFIGYWGDHQIIYLLKLMEISYDHSKDDLIQMLHQPYFVYANVPYVIRSYKDILLDPQNTIDFDNDKSFQISKKVEEYGADGKMVFGNDGNLLKANLTEKLLVSILAKISNFIPEGGIWLNTQRPEWNDANNALVGNGLSMVTLYYLRRHLSFCVDLFSESKKDKFVMHKPVKELLAKISDCFKSNKHILDDAVPDAVRKNIMDTLGKAGEDYRRIAYHAFADQGTVGLRREYLIEFLQDTLAFLDHTIKANKRKDGLYHSYNLLSVKDDKASVHCLYEMLEGQVAMLSSFVLTANETVDLLEALKTSKIYREDQRSYLLYPDKKLPTFLEKNTIPESFAESSELAQSLIDDGNTSLITKDVNGKYHFNGSFTNVNNVKDVLETLRRSGYKKQVEKEYDSYLEVFETMFNHKAFTGRSGTFFGYEGLGSIYWHMVSKLLLAIQENIGIAIAEKADSDIIKSLERHYYDVREGIGVHKSPSEYGAFPTDPYSHTPAHKGAQQPGMTGQVKEDILSRMGELGITVDDGKITFSPKILNEAELLKDEAEFRYPDLKLEWHTLKLEKQSLAFLYCQVPVIYKASNEEYMELTWRDGNNEIITGLQLNREISQKVFQRNGEIVGINVNINPKRLVSSQDKP